MNAQPVAYIRTYLSLPACGGRLGTGCWMDVGTGAPLLLFEGRGTDQPLEIFATWHRADQVAFDLDVSDQDAGSTLSGVGSDFEDDGHTIG